MILLPLEPCTSAWVYGYRLKHCLAKDSWLRPPDTGRKRSKDSPPNLKPTIPKITVHLRFQNPLSLEDQARSIVPKAFRELQMRIILQASIWGSMGPWLAWNIGCSYLKLRAFINQFDIASSKQVQKSSSWLLQPVLVKESQNILKWGTHLILASTLRKASITMANSMAMRLSCLEDNNSFFTMS